MKSKTKYFFVVSLRKNGEKIGSDMKFDSEIYSEQLESFMRDWFSSLYLWMGDWMSGKEITITSYLFSEISQTNSEVSEIRKDGTYIKFT